MDWRMKVGPLPVWAWGTIAALTAAALYGHAKSMQQSATSTSAPPVRTVGVTQVQPLLITPQGPPSTAVSNANAAANYYGGM
jgi:hypothetical protein